MPVAETHSIIKLTYKTLWIICLALLAVLLVFHMLSYILIVPKEYILCFLIPLFLFQLLAIQDYNTKSGFKLGEKRLSSQLKIHIRPWMAIIAILLFINYGYHFLSNMFFGGVPEMLDGQYVLNNHGAYTIVSEETYRDAVMSGNRTSSAIFILFLFLHFSYFKSNKIKKTP